jgi:hypothetical protein
MLPVAADLRTSSYGFLQDKGLPWRRRDGGTSESLRPTRRNDSNLSVFRAEQPRHVDDQTADNDARGEPEPRIAGNVAVDRRSVAANSARGTLALRLERVDGVLHSTLQLLNVRGSVVGERVEQFVDVLNQRVKLLGLFHVARFVSVGDSNIAATLSKVVQHS